MYLSIMEQAFWLTSASEESAGSIAATCAEGDEQIKNEDLVSVFNQPTVMNFATIFAGASAAIGTSGASIPGQTVPSLNQIGISPSKRATLIPMNSLQTVAGINHVSLAVEAQVTPTTTVVVNTLNGISSSTLATTVYTLPLTSQSTQLPKNFIQQAAAESGLTSTSNSINNTRNHILFSSTPVQTGTVYEIATSSSGPESNASSIASGTINAIALQPSQSPAFECNECGKAFENSGQLSYHTFVAHGELQARPHKCTACPESFLMEHHLRDHMRALHLSPEQGGGAPFMCSECMTVFDDGGHLNFHLYIAHTIQGSKSKQQQFPCPHCGKNFIKSTLRTAHIRNVHSSQASIVSSPNTSVGTTVLPVTDQGKSHKCSECAKAFKTQSYLRQHIMSVHNKPLKCTLCARGFGRKSDLKRHMRGVHMKKRPHVCNKCGWTFSEIGNLKHHLQAVHRKQKNFRCMYCDKTFALSSYLRTHLLRMHNINMDIVKAMPESTEESKVENLETESLQLTHTTEQGTVAVASQAPTVIGLTTSVARPNAITLEALQISIAQAHVARCYECGQTFANSQMLQEHVMSSHSQPFWCTLCGEGFSLASHLQLHLQLKHSDNGQPSAQTNTIQTVQAIDLQRNTNGEISLEIREALPAPPTITTQSMPVAPKQPQLIPSQPISLEAPVEAPAPLQEDSSSALESKCNMCGVVYNSSIEKHICWKKMHMTNSLSVDFTVGADRPHLCNDCGKGFKTMTHLKQHIRCVHSKEKPHKCGQCGKCFARTSDLNRHIKGVHQKLKNVRSGVFVTLKCSECGAIYAETSQLKRHIYTHHLRGKPSYKCADCQEGFTNEISFQNHICHEEERPHVCTVCSKRFQMVQQLRRHTRAAHARHTEEPQIHKCFQCERTFGRPIDLERHIQAVHLKEKPHKCTLCGKSFGLQGNLNKHVRAVHLLEKPHQCIECGKRFAHVGVLKRHLRDIHFYDKKASVKQKLAAIQMKKARALMRNISNLETIDAQVLAQPIHEQQTVASLSNASVAANIETASRQQATHIAISQGLQILPQMQLVTSTSQQPENTVQPQRVTA